MSTLLGGLGGVNRVRRNHALEHAAITVVTERFPHVFLRGRSTSKGFFVFGDIATQELRSSIDEALNRLVRGEADLAIHPRCGTNLAIAGILSGLAAALASGGRPRPNRFSYAILASLASLMVAPALGTEAQRYLTTEHAVGDLHVESIERRRSFGRTVHWVRTQST